jgi:hypothetical protein
MANKPTHSLPCFVGKGYLSRITVENLSTLYILSQTHNLKITASM